MKRRVVVVASVCLVALVGAFGLWRLSSSRTFQLFGELVARVETPRPVVALTFDDGPTAEGVEAILPVLAARNVRATFFLTGAELERRPDLGRRIVEAGHEIGNHSYSHQRMVFMWPSTVADEVERTDTLIRATGYGGPILFRPPYGKKLAVLPWYLARTHRTSVMCDVEPDSYPDVAETAEGIAAHVLERARPGSVVLLHVMYPSRRTSLEAVPAIVDGLRQRGLEPVPVAELLAAREP